MNRRCFLATPLLLYPTLNFAAKNRKLARWSVAPPVFTTDPSSSTNLSGSRSVLSSAGSNWTSKNDQTQREYGNIDWRNTDGDILLSWWGPPSRYWGWTLYGHNSSNASVLLKHGAVYEEHSITPNFFRYWRVDGQDTGDRVVLYNEAIYYKGTLIKNAPLRVSGAGVAVDPDPGHSDNIWLIAICLDSAVVIGHSAPGIKVYAAQWNNGTPGSWTSALASYSLTGTALSSFTFEKDRTYNLHPFCGRGDGLEYKSFRFDGLTENDIYDFTVTISFPTAGDVPTASIVKGSKMHTRSPYLYPDNKAFDYIGNTLVYLYDDGTEILYNDGSTDWVLFDATQRTAPSSGDSIFDVISADLRSGTFLVQETLYDITENLPYDRQVHVWSLPIDFQRTIQ